MPDSVIAHMATGFSQILYPLVFDTRKSTYENCEWDLYVWLLLKNLLASNVFIIFLQSALRKKLSVDSFVEHLVNKPV